MQSFRPLNVATDDPGEVDKFGQESSDAQAGPYGEDVEGALQVVHGEDD